MKLLTKLFKKNKLEQKINMTCNIIRNNKNTDIDKLIENQIPKRHKELQELFSENIMLWDKAPTTFPQKAKPYLRFSETPEQFITIAPFYFIAQDVLFNYIKSEVKRKLKM